MKLLPEYVKLAFDADIRLAVWGRHGVGKTAVIEALREEGYYVKTIILSQSDPLVLGGYPGRVVVGHDADTDSPIYATTFARPQWIRDLDVAEENGKRIIVFLDEFNRADVYAHNAAMRLVNEKEISGHKVPKGTCFIAAMNPETEGDAAVNPLTDPMMDRWCHVPVHSDAKNWLALAKKENNSGEKNINPLISDFISTDDSRLSGFDMKDMFEDQVLKRVLPTERSNHAVSRIIDTLAQRHDGEFNVKLIAGNTLEANAAHHMIVGLCGREYHTELITFTESIASSYYVSSLLD